MMERSKFRGLRRLIRDESGDAMVIAIIASMLMVLLPLPLLASSFSDVPLAQSETNFQRAMGAIDAGISDYMNRLNQASVSQAGNYWQYSSTNLPPDGNTAFTGWAQVPGTSSEYFHYNVINSASIASTGDVVLQVTGLSTLGSPSAERTVDVTLQSRGFLQNMLMWNISMLDPQLAQSAGSGLSASEAQAECAYGWDQPNPSATGDDSDSSYGESEANSSAPNSTYGPDLTECAGLLNYYGTGNTFNGPVFSNDIYYIYGQPIFNGPVFSASTRTTAYAVGSNDTHPYWVDAQCWPGGICNGDNPIFNSGGAIKQSTKLPLPTSDSELITIAKTAGCYYQGPTQIDLSGSTMTVISPETPAGLNQANCLGSSIPLPPNGVAYVDGTASTSSCTAALTGTGYSSPPNGCANGDVFIQGKLTGQLTIAGADSIYITGDLEYTNCAASGSSDALGLIANEFVYISNHFGSSNVTTDSCTGHSSQNPVVYGAILALNHSFGVDGFWNLTNTTSDTIYFTGSMSADFMDIEGEFSGTTLVRGYNMSYNYDQRLKYLSPPYFLSSVAAAWYQANFTEITNPAAASLPNLP